MGVIYLAEHRVMEKSVALKVISPAVLDNPEALARFQGEVKAAGRLDHPNIARAYDADQAGDLHFLVMEFVEGANLAQVLEQKGPLPIPHACHYVRQAALGLQHAFEQGMVHRDVKPQNLMLTPKGLVKVLDFGLARLRSERGRGGGLTQVDTFMGTPEYVSPEQAADARSADVRADIYSLGCTLYALLTGRPPFLEGTAVKLVLAHIEKEAKPLHELRPDVPKELSAIVARMLAKDPAQRFQTPVEVAQALAPFTKPGTKPVSGVVPPPLPVVGSAGKGTVIGGDTSKVQQKLRPDAGGKMAAPKAPERDTASAPFEGLADDVPPPRKAKRVRGATKPASRKKWLIGTGVAVGVLLICLLGLWAGGVFIKVKTTEGILVVEVNEPGAEVFVEGKKVVVTWGQGGKKAEVQAKPGAKVEVKKDGFTVQGEEVTVEDGKRTLKVRLVKSSSGTRERDPFFNGRDLTGWEGLPGYWHVEGGAIVGRCPPGQPGQNTFLVSKKKYKDFDLKFQARRKDGVGSTGVQFRSELTDSDTFPVGGPQCRINSATSVFPPGSLLTEPIADPLAVKAPQAEIAAEYKDAGFNDFHIRCVGKHVTIKVNGVTAIDGKYPEVPDEGVIAWQFNGWQAQRELTFRNIQFTDLSEVGAGDGFVPLFKGKDLNGWQSHYKQPSKWRVDERGILIGPGPALSHLYTERGDYKDFHLRMKARINEGAFPPSSSAAPSAQPSPPGPAVTRS
jgi:hypothetical protein